MLLFRRSRRGASDDPIPLLLDPLPDLRYPDPADCIAFVDGPELDSAIDGWDFTSCVVLVIAAPGLPGCRCSSNVDPGKTRTAGRRDGGSFEAVALGKLPPVNVEWDASCRSGGFAASTALKNKVCIVEDVFVGDGHLECKPPADGEGEAGSGVFLALS